MVIERERAARYALVAVAEARLAAKRTTGFADRVTPTTLQHIRIDAAAECSREDALTALSLFEESPLSILLYGTEGGFSAQDLLEEMRSGIEETN